MARKKVRIWTEAELILHFGLNRQSNDSLLLKHWISDIEIQAFTKQEKIEFDYLLALIKDNYDFWNEESLKMNFIAPLLHFFVKLNDTNKRYQSFFNYTISDTVEDTYLQTETDFMLAKGVGDIAQMPYFHFQEYKRSLKSPPEPIAQLLEAFLIAKAKNNNSHKLYGLVIVGRIWEFVVMQDKDYAISQAFDATQEEDLIAIIAILRKFKHILETELLEQ